MRADFEAPEWVRQLSARARVVNEAAGVLSVVAVGAGLRWGLDWLTWLGVVVLAVAIAVELGHRNRAEIPASDHSGPWFYGTLTAGLLAAAVLMGMIADWRGALLAVVIGTGVLVSSAVSAETRRWLWALSLGAATAAAALIGAALLYAVPLAPWGVAILALLALLVAARAFSRTTLRWVALMVALALAGGLAALDLRGERTPEVRLDDGAAAAGLPDDLGDLDGDRVVVVDAVRAEAELVTLLAIDSRSVQFGDSPSVEQSSLADLEFDGEPASTTCTGGKQIVVAIDRRVQQAALLRCDKVPDAATLPVEGDGDTLSGTPTGGGDVYRLRRPHQEPLLLAMDAVVVGIGELVEPEEATTVVLVAPEGDPKVSGPETIDTSKGQVVVVPGEGTPLVLPQDAAPDAGGGPSELAARVESGAGTLVDRGLAEIAGAESTTTLGVVGWIVLALLALIGYRRLEIVNGRRLAGPVTVKAIEGAASKEKAQALLAHTIARDIRNPATVPGALSATDLGSVATTLAGEEKGKPVQAILTAIQKISFPAGGYNVEALHRGPAAKQDGDKAKDADAKTKDAGDSSKNAGTKSIDAGDKGKAGEDGSGVPKHLTSVTLSDARTGQVVAVGALPGESEHESIENAGYFVARVLLDQSKTQPTWARWKSADGRALAEFHRAGAPVAGRSEKARLEKVDADIERLERARAASPGNALVRIELAHRYDIKDRKLDALQEHLAVRARHPHQWLAGYRLAVSLDFVAGKLESVWFSPNVKTTRRQDLVDQFHACGALDRLLADSGFEADVLDVTTVEELRERVSRGQPMALDRRLARFAFLHLAKLELRHVRSNLDLPTLLWNSLNQSERSHWQPLRGDRAARLREVGRVEVAQQKIEASLALARVDRAPSPYAAVEERRRAVDVAPVVDRLVTRDDSGWVARYNAACFYATLVAIDTKVIALATPEQATIEHERGAHVRTAIRLLRLAVNDPHCELRQPPVWIDKDPDLEPLRDVAEFERWKTEVMLATDEEK